MRERVIPSRAPVPASRCHGLKPAVLTLFLLPVITVSSECQTPSGNQEQIAEHQRLVQQYLRQQQPRSGNFGIAESH